MRFNSFVERVELLKSVVGFAYGAVSQGPEKGRFFGMLCNDVVVNEAGNLLRCEANYALKLGVHSNLGAAMRVNSTRRNRHVSG